MLRNECMRHMRRSIFWVMAGVIGVLIFIAMFAQFRNSFLWKIDEIMAGEAVGATLTGWENTTLPWGSFVSYAIPCCCVCAVCGGAMEDIESNRYNYMLSRSGCLRYAACNIAGVSIVSFLCMMIGNILYYAAALLIVRVPLYDEIDAYSSELLLASGQALLILFLHAVIASLCGVFMTLLATTLALWVHDRNIVVIFPAILLYFFYFIFDFPGRYTYYVIPKGIYLFPTFLGGSMLSWCGIAFLYTLIFAALAVAVLYFRVRSWKKQ